ncbi:unnamed protein product [Owenia fusiformis]|uniref:Uncharacterized protein n=1 Tax=Owenia fusiformis TaxID=6347 RepID=A0A8S4PZS8_OWEFU|nr:unnamed protein product [Owenia fusiformis]
MKTNNYITLIVKTDEACTLIVKTDEACTHLNGMIQDISLINDHIKYLMKRVACFYIISFNVSALWLLGSIIKEAWTDLMIQTSKKSLISVICTSHEELTSTSIQYSRKISQTLKVFEKH